MSTSCSDGPWASGSASHSQTGISAEKFTSTLYSRVQSRSGYPRSFQFCSSSCPPCCGLLCVAGTLSEKPPKTPTSCSCGVIRSPWVCARPREWGRECFQDSVSKRDSGYLLACSHPLSHGSEESPLPCCALPYRKAHRTENRCCQTAAWVSLRPAHGHVSELASRFSLSWALRWLELQTPWWELCRPWSSLYTIGIHCWID